MNMSRILTVGLLLVAALTSRAAIVTADINTFRTGGGVTTDQLVAKLTIKDVAPDQVEVKIESVWDNMVFGNGSFLSRLFLETTLSAAIPNGTYISGNTIDGWSNGGTNAGFSYDKLVKYPVSNNPNSDRFLTGEVSVFTLQASGLDATDFTRAMVHIQGIGNGDSAKFTGEAVPEPGTMIALGMGIAAAVRRRKKA
jgi:hypothetical protein